MIQREVWITLYFIRVGNTCDGLLDNNVEKLVSSGLSGPKVMGPKDGTSSFVLAILSLNIGPSFFDQACLNATKQR